MKSTLLGSKKTSQSNENLLDGGGGSRTNVYDGDSWEIVIRSARAGDHALMTGAALTAMQAAGAP